MKKINLLISSVYLDVGGIEKSLVNLINNLDLNKYNITLVLEDNNGIYKDMINKKIKVLEYKPSLNRLSNLFKRVGWILKHHNKYDVSICYATYSLPSNFIARSSARKKIMFIHSNYYEAFNRDINKVKEFYDIRYLDSYNKLIFVANESKNDLIKIYPNIKDKSIVINNIVNVDEIINGSKEKCKIELKNKYIGCFIGRLENDSKRINLIVRLAKKCKNDDKDIGFVLVGDGPDKYEILNKINGLDNIILVGLQSNPYKYLKNSDFLILTSRYEGYPVVYNEAIILGKPILTTLSITDDMIDIDGNYGIVSDINDLYDNLDKVVNMKPKRIDFNKINNDRINKVNHVIEGLYEEK